MPRTSETAFNPTLAEALRGKHPRWRDRIGAEQTNVLLEAARQPDIVIRHPGGLSVIVETEYEPASTVEDDALDRLGQTLSENGETIEQVVAVIVPAALKESPQGRLPEFIEQAEFRYCGVSGSTAGTATRWPKSGWLQGGINDLASFIEQTALSERRVAEGIKVLEAGVAQAAGRLRAELQHDYPDVLARVARALHQEDGEQTSRMAMAIVANALTFHTAIADTYNIPNLDDLRGLSGAPDKGLVLDAWDRITTEINYYPIFKIAREVLLPLPDRTARPILDRLTRVARELDGIGATTVNDLSGQMLGELIADRKFLATFYTLPPSAALLAELAVSRLDVDWAAPEAVKALQIADLACGTGALLSAAYRAIASRHRRAGGDDMEIHSAMIEESLIGADIMPAATHLTTSMLSSAHPTITFGRTRIHTMPYGGQDSHRGGGVAIGSLSLIGSDRQGSLLSTGEHVLHGGKEAIEVGAAAAGDSGDTLHLPHDSIDLMIMNPPFIRPTNHAAGREMPVPSFAGFDTSHDEQREMAKELRKVLAALPDRASHGHAGLASNFVDLAHVKTKPGAVLALVTPIALLSGKAWARTRALLSREYCNLLVVTIATTGQSERSFSADTGMGEALIIASKRTDASVATEQADVLYANLQRRPASIVEAVEMARTVLRAPDNNSGYLRVGDTEYGCFIRATLADGGCASLRQPDVATAEIALHKSFLRLPRMREAHSLPVTRLANLGRHGLHDLDIYGTKKDGTPQGPFDVSAPMTTTSSYPVLWAHNMDRERQLIVKPDREGRVKEGCEEQALDVWETATRLHLNRDFQLNSQSLAACLTPERSIGGRAWPNFRLDNPDAEEAIALWANTTLGLTAFWWAGGRQQQGRVIITITGLPSLLTLDVRQLSAAQLARAGAIFEEFCAREFLPANEAYRDETRQALDRAMLIDLLGLPETVLESLDVLRAQWCAEPTVHGGKKTRPTSS